MKLADTLDALTIQDIRNPASVRWTRYGDDVLPLWVADMDFPVAEAIVKALQARVTQPLTYPVLEAPTLKPLLQRHLATQGHQVPAEGIALLPGVVAGLYAAVFALSEPGEAVATMTPIYPPFHQAITNQGRRVAAAPLLEPQAEGQSWQIDWEALERATDEARLLMLCHPHNPTGRIWNAAELERLRELVARKGLWVVSDELHADVRYQPDFQSFAADPRVRERTLVLTGPCKAYNTPTLGIGALTSANPELVKRVREKAGGLISLPSALSVTMWQAALEGGADWLAQAVEYLRGNRDLVAAWAAQLPFARLVKGEGTYLAWLDLRQHPQAADIQAFLLQHAKVALQNGPEFAPAEYAERYQGILRLNYATPRPVLRQALEQLEAALTASRP